MMEPTEPTSPPARSHARNISIELDDAFSSGEDEPTRFDLKADAHKFRQELESQEDKLEAEEAAAAIPTTTSPPLPTADEAWYGVSLRPSVGNTSPGLPEDSAPLPQSLSLSLSSNEPRSPFANEFTEENTQIPRNVLEGNVAITATTVDSGSTDSVNQYPHDTTLDNRIKDQMENISLEDNLEKTSEDRNPGFTQSSTKPSLQDRAPGLTITVSTTPPGSPPADNQPPQEQTPQSASRVAPTWPPPEAAASPNYATMSFDDRFKQLKKSSASGASVLQKVISKTRPTYLPPKPKEEDMKHQKDWEEMMKMSREAQQKRTQAIKAQRLARERAIEESVPVWEKEIVPDWRAVREPQLRKLWWAGIPTKLRGTMWEKAIGNGLQLSKDTYKTCLARARRAISRESFPQDILEEIERDIDATLPALHLFHRETGPLYQDLKDLLTAWTVARSDEALGYVMGASRVAAMLLINLAPPQAFIAMRNLLDRHCLRSFYGGPSAKEDVEAYYRIFDTLLADMMPKVYFNFKQHHISPSSYLSSWLTSLFLDHLPFEATARLWDVILLEGDSFLFRASLGILSVLESRLFFPDREELMLVLNGESKAAMEVAKRNAGLTGEEGLVEIGARYEIYGMSEEALWENIYASDEVWKNSTWTRLIQRELPDI